MIPRHVTRLAELLSQTALEKGSPLGVACATGAVEGYPVAVGWNRRMKAGKAVAPIAGRQGQTTVTFHIRFKKGSLTKTAADLHGALAAAPALLAAMGKKELSKAERAAISVMDDGLTVRWDYSLRAPKPEAVAAALRALVAVVKGSTGAVGRDCEVCGNTRAGELGSVSGALMVVCPECRERMGEEDRKAIEAYQARASNPLVGTLFGVVAAIAGAVLWGVVAHGLHRIFLYGGILIGIGIAWAVNKGMGKINVYGRGLAVALTVASVLLGDFLFMLLEAAAELGVPAGPELAAQLAPLFLKLEFSDSSGYLSILFGVIGAVYILFANRPPVSRRVFVPVGHPATS